MASTEALPMARIGEISDYFDDLVNLIPAKHYFDPEESISMRYLKKEERASTKAAFKQEHRKTKRAKLDPDANMTTTELQKHRDAGKDASTSEAPGLAPLRANVFTTASTSELKERLQQKLQAFRENRSAKERSDTASQAQKWRETQQQASKQRPQKRKRDGSQGGKPKAAEGSEKPPVPGQESKAGAAREQDAADIMFSKLHVQEGKLQKKRKLSKQQLLKQAEAGAVEQRDGAAASGEKWDKYMKLAQGEKVLDDPQRLRKALKKEGKEKAKRKEAWQARTSAVAEKQRAAQQQRQANLQKRVDSKKAGKVAKREKKLMRPGFEGHATALPSRASLTK